MHFDICHNAPSWQRARYNNMIHLRSLDSNKQAGPLCKRPGYKEATRGLVSFPYVEGQGVSYYISVWSRTRQNDTPVPELRNFLEWSSFHCAEYFAEPQNSERQQPSSSSSSWSPSPTWRSSFVILGATFARMALSWVARQRVVGQKVRTTITDSRCK